jgi:cytochrome P450
MAFVIKRSGYDRPFVLQQYGEEFRKQRRMVAQGFNQAIVPEYYSIQETEARKLARNILDDPSTLKDEIQL